MATLNWWNFKAESEASGLDWRDVLATYEECRAEHNEWFNEVKAIRTRCWALGIRKNHPAFWRGDQDLNDIYGFDVIVRSIAYEFTWLAGRDDADTTLFELLRKNNSELTMSEDECFRKAIERLECLLLAGRYTKSSDVLARQLAEVPF
jgi:hypothetical protein